MSQQRASRALFTDLYELTMGSAYLEAGIDDIATFELWVRELPHRRNFLLVAGLEAVLEYLETLAFDSEDLAYLRSLDMFQEAFLERLAGLRFSGDLWAIPEGEIAFPDEPLLRVVAPRVEAQLVETALLTAVNFETMIATKAARVAIAAQGVPFVDFSPRRDHGLEAAVKVARASYIAGAAGTSNVLAAKEYGLTPSGTMAHAFVLSFDSELEAFRAFARRFPNGPTLLIDTFDNAQGARNAAIIGRELRQSGGHLGAVRIDSGDLGEVAKLVRGILDEEGFPDVRIFASGDLDEYRIAELLGAGAPIDGFGVGTRLGTSSDAPSLGGIYKLVEDSTGGRAKFSSGKQTLPGTKQVYRQFEGDRMARDIIALASEPPLPGTPLLEQVMAGGRRTGPAPSLDEIRARAARSLAALPQRLKSLDTVEPPYPVEVSKELREEAARSYGRYDGSHEDEATPA